MSSPHDRTAAGMSTAVPTGPSGRPISVEVSTSTASCARPCPSCAPKAMPLICVIMPIIGPAICAASSGSASAHIVDICVATGSHSRRQLSKV